MKSSMLGETPILSGSMLIMWRGAWVLDADLDLPSTTALPTGSVSPNVAASTLKGTIDPSATFRFGEKAKARIVAGAGAWSNTALAKHFHSDAGMTSDYVINATANEIGETANDTNPIGIGIDYVRLGVDVNGKGIEAPAARVIGAGAEQGGGRDWYVDANGITQIASWPASTPTDDVEVLEFDEEMQKLIISSDSIVWPGTVFNDPRFGTLTVRDVELTFTAKEFRTTAWCSSVATSRMQSQFRESVREAAQVDYGKIVRYRITQQNSDGRLQLTAVDPGDGFPQTLPLSVWPGMAGLSAKYVTGTVVLVEFIGRDPKNPIVRGFDGSSPIELDLMATALAKLYAAAVKIGSDSAGPVTLANPMLQILAAMGTMFTADVALLSNPPTSIMFAAYAPAKLALLNTMIAAIAAEIGLLPTVITECA
jgi:hypothetical protein